MTLLEVGFLVLTGVLAGTASSVGAIGSLIAYPALLAVGLAPISANATNTVAVVAVGIGATAGSRAELRAVPPRRLLGGAMVAVAGGLGGALLLLGTPAGVFARVVPFLVLLGVVALVVQPRVRALSATEQGLLFPVGLLLTTLYEGYFGAGAGVLTLAVVLLTVDRSLPHANAQKNLLLGVADAVAGIVFILDGSILWEAVAALAVGYLGGGLIGPALTRRLPPAALRAAVACFGTALFVVLLLRGYR